MVWNCENQIILEKGKYRSFCGVGVEWPEKYKLKLGFYRRYLIHDNLKKGLLLLPDSRLPSLPNWSPLKADPILILVSLTLRAHTSV